MSEPTRKRLRVAGFLFRAPLWGALLLLYSVDFGFRSFEARDGKFYLNGQPCYMIAALDQDFYPETIYTPPSKNYVRDQMTKAKQLGLNLLRCHIKVCDPTYLEAADEVGMRAKQPVRHPGRPPDRRREARPAQPQA